MNEHSIIFNSEMVRKILSGQKTQTRRIAKLTDTGRVKASKSNRNWHVNDKNAKKACPYGAVGDHLWVRENFRWIEPMWGMGSQIQYKADEGFMPVPEEITSEDPVYSRLINWSSGHGGYKPSIHMPRWASRITLEITGVRLQRLQEINDKDIIAEGWRKRAWASEHPDVHRDAAKDWFMDLWDEINGPGAWTKNPLVWAVTFKLIEQ